MIEATVMGHDTSLKKIFCFNEIVLLKKIIYNNVQKTNTKIFISRYIEPNKKIKYVNK